MTQKKKPAPPNPKELIGSRKASLRYIPMSVWPHDGAAHAVGAAKYGPFNWRDDPVEAMTYIEASLRHLIAYAAGENLDPESRVSQLAHVRACCAILMDAELHGTLIDNRHESPGTLEVLKQFDRSKNPCE